MKARKMMGIVSSLLLIGNYVSNLIFDLMIQDIHYNQFRQTTGSVIFAVCMIAFYYSLTRYFKPHGLKAELQILYVLIILQIVSLPIGFFPVIPQFIYGIFNIMGVVFFILLGIRILKRKNEELPNLKILKSFTISMFVVMAVVFSSFIMFSAFLMDLKYQPEFSSIIISIYAIPYIIGILFFLKDRSRENSPEQLISAEAEHSTF